jgi:prepilin-type processing-associated H-X9-DG protein
MAKNPPRAFTLFELFVVFGLIAILASVAYPVYIGALERAKVTKDLNNLRQIGIATQTYMNDNDGVLFTAASPWVTQLNPKYASAWAVYQSPFDTRSPSELGNATTPISYGLNGTTATVGTSIAGWDMIKVYKPSALIIFAPAQNSGGTVNFDGNAGTGAPGVTVVGIGGGQATSTPGGTNPAPPPPHGTHSTRGRINALFADWHVETMNWTTFANDSDVAGDPDGRYRWDPTATPTPPP